MRPVYGDQYFADDDVLGTLPIKQTQSRSSEWAQGKLVYDVTYTVGANGLRIAPPVKTAAPGVFRSFLWLLVHVWRRIE